MLANKDLTRTKFWMYLQCWPSVRQTFPAYTVLLYFKGKNGRSSTCVEKKICLGSDYTRNKKLPFLQTIVSANIVAYKRTAEDNAFALLFNKRARFW